MLNETFARRFKELDQKFDDMSVQQAKHSEDYYKPEDWKKWATSAQTLILAVYGELDPHCKNFQTTLVAIKEVGWASRVRALYGEFLSAKEDFEGGYVFNVDLRVSGEVFGDFVTLAKKSLSEGHKDVAAVLACAALEDALKRFAHSNGLNVDDKTMAEVINALKGKSLVSGAQKSLLDAMPRIRNAAMHGDWAKLSEPDVGSVIAFVEQFLLTKFSQP